MTSELLDVIRWYPSMSFKNADRLACETMCSCYHCLQRFDTKQLTEWIDDGYTALCPHCNIDAIVPGKINKSLLSRAYEKYFSS